ncbi:MAG: methionine adenosyltransferase [bacterium]|nr:methionine adenosyltransferase [bacterium]
MNVTFLNSFSDLAESEFEIVERKGRGHPDTLSDRLAELLSRTYCRLSREKFGTVLRHQFDKLTLMGGKCDVRFGGGNFVSPVRLLINGRATPEVGGDKLFYRDALIETASKFLEIELRNFDFLTNCRLMLEISVNTTRGILLDGQRASSSSAYSRFRPGKLTDLPEYTKPMANDTAVGCGWAPYTPLESLVREIEGKLNSDETKKIYPWIGSDIKVMAIRTGKSVRITICVPQISTLVSSTNQYKENLQIISKLISDVGAKYIDVFKIKTSLNTGDGSRDDLFYMLYTGSCVESGDEGQVGRGNRLGGVISSRRPFSIEGLNGKNPQYHAGKIYSVMAWELAQKIWQKFNLPSEVFITSQSDSPINEPWSVIVNSTQDLDKKAVQILINEMLQDVGGFTDRLILGEYPLV